MGDCCLNTLNLCIYQGQTYTRVFTWYIQSCGCNTVGAAPAAVDLTGYTAAMQIRPYPLSTTLLYDATPDITLGGESGTITLTIPSTDTESFTWWQGVYDLFLTSPGGIVTPFIEGEISVIPSVTRIGILVPLLTDDGLQILADDGTPIVVGS